MSNYIINADVNDGLPYFDDVPPITKDVLNPPYPIWVYSLDGLYNDGLPYIRGLRPAMQFVDVVKQKDYISVYDKSETNFAHNGLRILCPTSCEITEELNGGYELTMSHPLDIDGNYLFIQELNILKVQGQLFIIYKKQSTMDSSGNNQITVNARHIFYELNNNYLEDVRPTDKNGSEALQWILNNTFSSNRFTASSNITTVLTAYYQDMSPTYALIGADNSFINTWGGELHRDNFRFSINTRKENSADNAFNISYGVDMTEIDCTVDYSEVISRLIAVDNYGNKVNIGASTIYGKTIKKVFNYDTEDYNRFHNEAMAYYNEFSNPSISYRVSFANLKNNPLYANFINLQRCNLGDTGYIKHEQLAINANVKIVKKTVGGITGDVNSIELGTIRNSITRPKKYTNTTSPQDINTVMFDKLYNEMYKGMFGTYKQLENYTYDQLEKYTYNNLEGKK